MKGNYHIISFAIFGRGVTLLLTNKYFYEAEQLSLLFPDSVLPITFIMKATLSDNKDSVYLII